MSTRRISPFVNEQDKQIHSKVVTALLYGQALSQRRELQEMSDILHSMREEGGDITEAQIEQELKELAKTLAKSRERLLEHLGGPVDGLCPSLESFGLHITHCSKKPVPKPVNPNGNDTSPTSTDTERQVIEHRLISFDLDEFSESLLTGGQPSTANSKQPTNEQS